MGLIHIELFTTLDLVGQRPAAPTRTRWGSRSAAGRRPCWTRSPGAGRRRVRGHGRLLLGRRTYDLFAAYWPHQKGGQDNEIATLFNSVPKYVAPAAGPTSPGPGPRSSARIWPTRCARSATGTSM